MTLMEIAPALPRVPGPRAAAAARDSGDPAGFAVALEAAVGSGPARDRRGTDAADEVPAEPEAPGGPGSVGGDPAPASDEGRTDQATPVADPAAAPISGAPAAGSAPRTAAPETTVSGGAPWLAAGSAGSGTTVAVSTAAPVTASSNPVAGVGIAGQTAPDPGPLPAPGPGGEAPGADSIAGEPVPGAVATDRDGAELPGASDRQASAPTAAPAGPEAGRAPAVPGVTTPASGTGLLSGTGVLSGTGLAAPAAAVGPYALDGLGPVSRVLAGRLLAGDGAHTLVVHLNPAALGPVRVSATLRGGALGIELSGGTEGAREALRASLSELSASLAGAGLDAGVRVTDLVAEGRPAGVGGHEQPGGRETSPDPRDRGGDRPNAAERGDLRPGAPRAGQNAGSAVAIALADRSGSGPRLDIRI
ncbi:MAG: flagellar hook-length control protein FliK [Kineosporiaceae bacterium]